MSQNENGNKKSFKDQLKDYEAILDKYLNSIGADKFSYDNIVLSVINMDYAQLSKLTNEECREYRFLLLQYVLFLQKEFNRNLSRKRWAEAHLDQIVARQQTNYQDKYMKYEAVRNKIISGDSSAQVLNLMIIHADGRLNELSGLSDRISDLSRALGDMAFRKQEK